LSPYSKDLRTKIITAFQTGGQSQREIASRFSVSLTFVHKLIKQFQKTGEITPRPHGGGQRPKIDPGILSALKEEIDRNPAATLDHLRRFLRSGLGVEVSNATIYRALKRDGARKGKPTARTDHGRRNKASA
jgi:transposase